MKIYKSILILIIIAFSSGNIYSQHLFSVNYGDLSQDNKHLITTEVTRINTSVSEISMTKNRDNKDVYSLSLLSLQNTKIVILNEETGNNVVIIPEDGAPMQFELSPFLIEELRQAVLGDAERYLVIETGADFSVRNAASVSARNQEVFIPRYFYGTKEDVKEALPEDRQIINIFKEKPRFIPAFPDDPENLRYIAQLEEEMSYYVYMYKLPDGILCIYDEHFNPSEEKNGVVNTITRGLANLQFVLSGNMAGQGYLATLHAFNLWSEKLGGKVPVDINISLIPISGTTLGRSYTQQNFLDNGTYFPQYPNTWYSSAQWNQIVGYDATTQQDILIEMNSNISWYYGITGNPSSNQYDWITIMLHEVTHGLGFFPLCGSNGAYSYGAYPGIFDRQLYQGATGNTCLTDLTQSQRAALVTSGNLYAGRPGSNLLAANGGTRVKMYAPNSWNSGSSVSHWDDNLNPNFTTFMKRNAAYGFKLHTFNTRKIGMMLDIGWKHPGYAPPCTSPTVNFTNQTVSTNQTVTSQCNIYIKNVTVSNNAKLTIDAANSTTIDQPFEVKLGSLLEVK